MKAARKMAAGLLLMILCLGILAVPAEATTAKHDGLEITIETDKDQYEANESITATITVRNTTREDITIINLEQLIPEGYKLAEDSDAYKREVTLRPGRKLTLTVTLDSEAVEETESSEDLFSTLFEGKAFGISKILLWILLIAAFVIFMILT